MRRPGRQPKAVLDKLKTADKGDYEKLLKKVMQALLKGDKHVIIRSSHLTRFPRGFPKGIKYKSVGDLDYRRAPANKLLDWLRAQGHTDVTMEDVRVAGIRFTMFEKEILNGFAST